MKAESEETLNNQATLSERRAEESELPQSTKQEAPILQHSALDSSQRSAGLQAIDKATCLLTDVRNAKVANVSLPDRQLSETIVEKVKAVSAGAKLAQHMQEAARRRLPGQFLFENFVSQAEQQELINFVDACQPPWQISNFNGTHRLKAWGVRMDLQKRTVSEPEHPMPPELQALADRMRELQPLASFSPTEANANDYYPKEGMFLGPHVDDRQLSTGAIVTLSLVSAAVMSFQRDSGPNKAKHRVLLPPGSLQVLTRESRYSYTHAIDLQDFHGSRRLSITFRQSPLRK